MKKFVLILFVSVFCLQAEAQVSISVDNSAPDPSSMLDIKSANKGLLAPRVSLSATNLPAPVSSPAIGLQVYNTATAGMAPYNVSPGIYSWDGVQWIPGSAPKGVNTGDMQYWNGSQWVLISAGVYGQQLFFCNGIPVWGGCPPVIATATVSNITSNSAVSGGNITLDGGLPVLARGICWSNHPNPTIDDSKTTDGTGTGSFVSNISGLSPNTHYFVRSYATNSAATGYGNESGFTTLCEFYPIVGVSIEASVNPVCSGTSVTFTSAPVNGGTAPEYQWKKSGTAISGATNATYTYIPADGDNITVTLTSNEVCISGNPATSNTVAMMVIAAPVAPAAGTHTPLQSQITWQWNAVNGATGYRWGTTGNYNDATDMGTATTNTETGLTCSTPYTRYVWAYNVCGNSVPVTLTQSTSACTVTCGSSFTDSRDNKVYTTVLIGSQCWMKQNLNIGTRINGADEQTNENTIEKYCYGDLDSNCDIYGGLYQWNEMMQYVNTPGVQGICPAGWHIPTDAQWAAVITFLGGESVAGGKMKTTGTLNAGTGLWTSPNVGATNESGFTALPAGFRLTYGTFNYISVYVDWWSSSESSSDKAWDRYLTNSNTIVTNSSDVKSYGFSVRCLRDF